MGNPFTDAPPRILMTPGELANSSIRAALRGPVHVELDPAVWSALASRAASLQKIAASGRAIYGLNTGFGKLAKTRIPNERLATLQRNLVLSHSAGVGPPLAESIVRLILLLKANGLARGYSGVGPQTVEALLALLRHNVLPIIPSKGSVGASGDLAPLAHLSQLLIGEGHALVRGGEDRGSSGTCHCRPDAAGSRSQRRAGTP